MKTTNSTLWQSCLGILLAAGQLSAAAPASPQGFITGNAFNDIGGTAIAALTGSPKFPNSPDEVFFLPYFEWNATDDIQTPPGNWSNNYGGQIVGYFYPPSSGEYVFWIAADDNAELYLSTDDDPANKKLIARETAWSNAREYDISGGNSDLTAKDSSQFTGTQWDTVDPSFGGAIIELQAGQAYYIEALFKEGGGGDNLSVAAQDPTGALDPFLPIEGEFLASNRTLGPASITAQPQNQSVDERGDVTFTVGADGTPPYSYQWSKNGEAIDGATGLSLTVSGAAMSDDGAVYSVEVTGADGSATSDDAVLTVIPDTVAPSVLGAKGISSLTEVVLTFSEPMDQATAETPGNYSINGGGLNVTDASLSPSGTVVTLTTASQTLGTKYTIIINNLIDSAASPNPLPADTKAVFFPTGKLQEIDGFIVFEAENYDRNLDDLWIRDTERGNPSGGVSMVNVNGSGGSVDATRLEYDITFEQSEIYRVWYRASGDNGNDDSGWLYIDDERPFGREDGNSASMTGFSGAADFVWRSDSQDGPDPYTIDVLAGEAIVALARREDGSYFDKFIFTTDMDFTPTGFGPAETREGAPGAPTVELTGPVDGEVFAAGGSLTFSATGTGDSGLEIDRVEFTANGELVATATGSPFEVTWNNLPDGIFGIRATAFDEIGQSVTSQSVTVSIGNPPPQGLLVVGTASDPELNTADAGVKERLEAQGWQVSVVQAPASVTTDADGKQLVVVSSTVNSGDVGDKFRHIEVPVIAWEQAVQDNFLMTLDDGSVRGTLADQTEIDIVNADHPLAGGLSTGIVTTTTAPQAYSWGTPNENAVIIATIADNPDQAVVYGYEKGAGLIDDTPAPERRVMFLWGDDGFAAHTDEVLSLFDAAVEWASGIAPSAPGAAAANIAWVSFHAADDEPSGAADQAGFTAASDAVYTELLRTTGHNVTRFITSGTPDVGVLNAHDLVIISRSVSSGDYQDASEAGAWNSIEAPMLILGGYVLRTSRLGLTTGTTMVDTEGPIKLQVEDPSHPIFNGISLDNSNLMVNDYATVVEFDGTVQRGVSINNNDPAGDGVVLASVGSDADPTFGGMVIGEWQAGDVTENGSADVLGGHRVVLLTGSREAAGLTSQGAGIYDLFDDGATMFLNAVEYMTGKAGAPGGGEPAVEPTISIARDGAGISVTFTGTLQSADSVDGPWTDEAGASSPLSVGSAGARKFYRAVE